MNCPDCGNPNPATATECEFCGRSLVAGDPARKTQLDRSAGLDAGKRRTMYDPGPVRPVDPPRPEASRAPAGAVHPAGDPVRGAPSGPSPGGPADPFLATPRRAAPDPIDPFRVAAAPPAPPTVNQATIAEAGDRPVAGALVARARAADPGTVYVLREGRNSVGRDEGHDVRIPDGKVSGLHGFVFVRPDGASFIDVSTNGSLLDGAVLHGQQGELRDGSWLRLGATVLVFVRLPAAPAAAWEAT